LFAHGFATFVRAVAELHAVGYIDSVSVAKKRVRSSHIKSSRCDLHAGTGDNSLFDEVFDVNVGVECAFGFKIAKWL